MQTDPIGTKDDLNLYAYVYNDPVDKNDPTGKCEPLCGVILGGTIGFLGDVGAQLIANRGDVQNIDWGEAGRSTVAGALAGLTGVGIMKTTASAGAKVLAAIAVSAEVGAVNKMTDNVAKEKPVGEGVGKAATISGLLSAAGQAAGPIIKALGTPLPSVSNVSPSAGPAVTSAAAVGGPVVEAVGGALAGADEKLAEKNNARAEGKQPMSCTGAPEQCKK